MKIIGLFGGTFNPVHLGHLHVAKEVLALTPITEVHLLPCYQPVHRATPDVSVEHRLAMLQLAIKNEPNMKINTTELDRQGPSFMIDTLISLKAQKPKQRLNLILGFDAYCSLEQWKDWQALINYCNLVVVNRPGSAPMSPKLEAWAAPLRLSLSEQLVEYEHGRILMVDIRPSPVTATQLRDNLAHGFDVNQQLPPGVLNYIKKHQLYQKLK